MKHNPDSIECQVCAMEESCAAANIGCVGFRIHETTALAMLKKMEAELKSISPNLSFEFYADFAPSGRVCLSHATYDSITGYTKFRAVEVE